ncbi:type I polyketide synthase, partial [Streptomyces sp. NPDC048057]|uniref:type I polyketide synthase n=1 Tax=Streptomyces sp. NPDC048057 TaxID=3155628 RepID=UPI0033F9DD4D
MSGTNAHIILEQPRPEPAMPDDVTQPVTAEPSPSVWLLSGHTPQALRARAEQLHGHVEAAPETELASVARVLATGRSALEHRASFTAADRQEALAALTSLASGAPAPGTVTGEAVGPTRTAFLFTGQGSQRPQMGAQLHATQPAFATAFDEACAALDPHLDQPLRDLILAAPNTKEATLLNQTQYTQPALFAHETALFRLLEHWGIRPEALLGHSIGSLTAVHTAGVLSLEDAATLVATRARLMQELPSGGAMAALSIGEEEASALLEGFEDRAAVAALNGPRSTVVSGAGDAVLELMRKAAARGAKTRQLPVSHAFHSPLMEPVLDRFREVVAELSFSAPQIPVVSDLTGRMATADELSSADYWVRHARETVRFADGMRTLHETGIGVCLEIGPDAVLSVMAADSAEGMVSLSTQHRGREETRTLASAVGALHAAGGSVDWTAHFGDRGTSRVTLPAYPFQRERYWLDIPTTGTGDVHAAGLEAADHPLLGAAVELADDAGTVFTGRVSVDTHPWLADHAVLGSLVLPGTALLELALHAARKVGCDTVEELTLQAPLPVPGSGAVQLQLTVGPTNDEGRRTLVVHSRKDGGTGTWTAHASGVLATQAPSSVEAVEPWPPQGAQEVDTSSAYEELASLGYVYGPTFQGLRAAWSRGEEQFAELVLPDAARETPGNGSGSPNESAPHGFCVHPALLDAALHPLALAGADDSDGLRLPFSWSGVRLYATGARAVRLRLTPAGPGRTALLLTDEDGAPVLSADSIAVREADSGWLTAARRTGDALHQLHWVAAPSVSTSTVPFTLLKSDDEADELIQAVEDGGEIPRYVLLTANDPATDSPHAATARTLAVLRRWLGEERLATSQLAIVTYRATAVRNGEPILSLGQSALWGLVRSAQSEHPGRFILIDTDNTTTSHTALTTALTTNEPQLALRNGHILLPRLTPANTQETPTNPTTLNPNGTVL